MSNTEKTRRLPFLEGGRTTGFASPAHDFEEARLDLFSKLIRNPDATFFAVVDSDDLLADDLRRGDFLIIDRSLRPFHGALLLVFHENERQIGRVAWLPNQPPRLIFSKKSLKPIQLDATDAWGVVSWKIRLA